MDKDTLRQNAIDWNRNQFFRAIKDERWRDAERYKDNVEKLEADGQAWETGE